MAKNKLRVGMIGCGHISSQHGPAWLASPDAELVALCDQDAGRVSAKATEWGVANTYSDPAAMIAHEKLDILDIITRPDSHASLVRLAAQNGLHILCQKPLASTLAEATSMVEVCRSAGVRFMVTEMWRFLPWFRLFKNEIDRGSVGRPYYLRIIGARRRMPRSRPVNPVQPYFADMPMLIVYELMIHWIDAARYVLGDVEGVFARSARINSAIIGEDAAIVVLTHRSGATCNLDGSWAAHGFPPGPTREGDIVLEGSEGSLHFVPLSGMVMRSTAAGTETIGSFPDMANAFQSAFSSCIGHFARSIQADEPFESSGEDNLRTLEATLAAYKSIESGALVRVGAGMTVQ